MSFAIGSSSASTRVETRGAQEIDLLYAPRSLSSCDLSPQTLAAIADALTREARAGVPRRATTLSESLPLSKIARAYASDFVGVNDAEGAADSPASAALNDDARVFWASTNDDSHARQWSVTFDTPRPARAVGVEWATGDAIFAPGAVYFSTRTVAGRDEPLSFARAFAVLPKTAAPVELGDTDAHGALHLWLLPFAAIAGLLIVEVPRSQRGIALETLSLRFEGRAAVTPTVARAVIGAIDGDRASFLARHFSAWQRHCLATAAEEGNYLLRVSAQSSELHYCVGISRVRVWTEKPLRRGGSNARRLAASLVVSHLSDRRIRDSLVEWAIAERAPQFLLKLVTSMLQTRHSGVAHGGGLPRTALDRLKVAADADANRLFSLDSVRSIEETHEQTPPAPSQLRTTLRPSLGRFNHYLQVAEDDTSVFMRALSSTRRDKEAFAIGATPMPLFGNATWEWTFVCMRDKSDGTEDDYNRYGFSTFTSVPNCLATASSGLFTVQASGEVFGVAEYLVGSEDDRPSYGDMSSRKGTTIKFTAHAKDGIVSVSVDGGAAKAVFHGLHGLVIFPTVVIAHPKNAVAFASLSVMENPRVRGGDCRSITLASIIAAGGPPRLGSRTLVGTRGALSDAAIDSALSPFLSECPYNRVGAIVPRLWRAGDDGVVAEIAARASFFSVSLNGSSAPSAVTHRLLERSEHGTIDSTAGTAGTIFIDLAIQGARAICGRLVVDDASPRDRAAWGPLPAIVVTPVVAVVRGESGNELWRSPPLRDPRDSAQMRVLLLGERCCSISMEPASAPAEVAANTRYPWTVWETAWVECATDGASGDTPEEISPPCEPVNAETSEFAAARAILARLAWVGDADATRARLATESLHESLRAASNDADEKDAVLMRGNEPWCESKSDELFLSEVFNKVSSSLKVSLSGSDAIITPGGSIARRPKSPSIYCIERFRRVIGELKVALSLTPRDGLPKAGFREQPPRFYFCESVATGDNIAALINSIQARASLALPVTRANALTLAATLRTVLGCVFDDGGNAFINYEAVDALKSTLLLTRSFLTRARVLFSASPEACRRCPQLHVAATSTTADASIDAESSDDEEDSTSSVGAVASCCLAPLAASLLEISRTTRTASAEISSRIAVDKVFTAAGPLFGPDMHRANFAELLREGATLVLDVVRGAMSCGVRAILALQLDALGAGFQSTFLHESAKGTALAIYLTPSADGAGAARFLDGSVARAVHYFGGADAWALPSGSAHVPLLIEHDRESFSALDDCAGSAQPAEPLKTTVCLCLASSRSYNDVCAELGQRRVDSVEPIVEAAPPAVASRRAKARSRKHEGFRPRIRQL